jgi:2,4-dienoyl-CoA reductase (NADPH2)
MNYIKFLILNRKSSHITPGLAFATTAARRGHHVTLFEKEAAIGGQFNMAKLVVSTGKACSRLQYDMNVLRVC